jgi:hypothetical protein
MINLAFEISLVIHVGVFNRPLNLTTWGWRLYFLYEGRRAEDFYRSCKSFDSAGFHPANLGLNGKHANHYTTEATMSKSYSPILYLTLWSSHSQSASKLISRLPRNTSVHHHIHKSPPLVPFLRPINTVYTLTPYFLNIHFNIILIMHA